MDSLKLQDRSDQYLKHMLRCIPSGGVELREAVARELELREQKRAADTETEVRLRDGFSRFSL